MKPFLLPYIQLGGLFAGLAAAGNSHFDGVDSLCPRSCHMLSAARGPAIEAFYNKGLFGEQASAILEDIIAKSDIYFFYLS